MKADRPDVLDMIVWVAVITACYVSLRHGSDLAIFVAGAVLGAWIMEWR